MVTNSLGAKWLTFIAATSLGFSACSDEFGNCASKGTCPGTGGGRRAEREQRRARRLECWQRRRCQRRSDIDRRRWKVGSAGSEASTAGSQSDGGTGTADGAGGEGGSGADSSVAVTMPANRAAVPEKGAEEKAAWAVRPPDAVEPQFAMPLRSGRRSLHLRERLRERRDLLRRSHAKSSAGVPSADLAAGRVDPRRFVAIVLGTHRAACLWRLEMGSRVQIPPVWRRSTDPARCTSASPWTFKSVALWTFCRFMCN
jgi:hypothetical protein